MAHFFGASQERKAINEEFVEMLLTARKKAQDEHRAQSQVPANCHFCEHMYDLPGYCSLHKDRVPQDFASATGRCPDFLQEIPF